MAAWGNEEVRKLIREEVPPQQQTRSSNLEKGETEVLHIKEEEDDATSLTITRVLIKSEDESDEDPSSQFNQSEDEPHTSSSSQHIETDHVHQGSLSSESDTDELESWKKTSYSESGSSPTDHPGVPVGERTIVDKSPTCCDCGKRCTSWSGLTKHRDSCSGSHLSCLVCGKGFTHRGTLNIHLRIHTGEKPFNCSICGKCFNQRQHLKRHIWTHGGERPYYCSLCGKQFMERRSLKAHMIRHTREKPVDYSEHDVQQPLINTEEVSCEQQDQSSSLAHEESEHHVKEVGVSQFHFSPVLVKSEDDEEESSRVHHTEEELSHNNLENHLKIKVVGKDSGGHTPSSCLDLSQLPHFNHQRPHLSECDTERESSNESSVDNPAMDKPEVTEKVDEDNSLTCSGCGRQCSSKSGLTGHKKTCSGEKYFTCPVCGKYFTKKDNLKAHMRIHTGERPFICSECGKCFNQREHMVRHMRIHTGEKPYGCSQCEKSFIQREDLKRHERIHTREKPYPCLDCGKCFTSTGSLKKHTRIHTGEKPFSCPQCGKYFNQSQHLKRHIRIHLAEREYPCLDCGKSFTSVGNLNIHRMSHAAHNLKPDD